MASAYDDIQYFSQDMEPHPAGTEGEYVCSMTIDQRFRESGLETNIQTFAIPQLASLVYPALALVTIVAVILSGLHHIVGIIAFLLAAVAGVVWLGELLGKAWLSSQVRGPQSQNVLARHASTGPINGRTPRPVVVVAHYDNPRINYLYHPLVSQYLGLLIKVVNILMLTLPVALILQCFNAIPAPVRKFFWILTLIAIIPLVIFTVARLLEQLVAPVSAGANINTSGVAVLFKLAERLYPNDSLPVSDDEEEFEETFEDEDDEDYNLEDFLNGIKPKHRVVSTRVRVRKSAEEFVEDEPAVTQANLQDVESIEDVETAQGGVTQDVSLQDMAVTTPEAGTDKLEMKAVEPQIAEPKIAKQVAEPQVAKASMSRDAAPKPKPVRRGLGVARAAGIFAADTVITYADAAQAYEMGATKAGAGAAAAGIAAGVAETAQNTSSSKVLTGSQIYQGIRSRFADLPVNFKINRRAAQAEVAEDAPVEDAAQAPQSEEAQAAQAVQTSQTPESVRIVPRDEEEHARRVKEREEAARAQAAQEAQDAAEVQATEDAADKPGETDRDEKIQAQDTPAADNVTENAAFEQDTATPEEPQGSEQTQAIEVEKVADSQGETVAPAESAAPATTDMSIPVTESVSEPRVRVSVQPSSAAPAPSTPVATPVSAVITPEPAREVEPISSQEAQEVLEQLNWGTSDYRPVKSTGLFDLPDPSISAVDPFSVTDISTVGSVNSDDFAVSDFATGTFEVQPESQGVETSANEAVAPITDDEIARAPRAVVRQARPIRRASGSRTTGVAHGGVRGVRGAEQGSAFKRFGEKIGGLFGGRKHQEEDSMSEWLDLDENFDAKTSGRQIGSWDNFNDDETTTWDNRGDFKGGGVSLVDADDMTAFNEKHVMAGGDGDPDAEEDMFTSDEPMTEEQEALMRERIVRMNDRELNAHEIWLVALGAGEQGNAGMKALLKEYKRELRGAFFIHVYGIGAGNLATLTKEGNFFTRNGDRRLRNLMHHVADQLHIPLASTSVDWFDTDVTPAMRAGYRSITLAGMDGKNFALSHALDDVPENIDEAQIDAVVDMIAETIRRS